MLVIFHAGTVLAAPVISFSVDAMRFHNWLDAPVWRTHLLEIPVAYFVRRLGSFAVVVFLLGLSSFSCAPFVSLSMMR
jgi:hypothetical protein